MIGPTIEFASLEAAFYLTAALMLLSGLVVQLWIEETHPEFGTHEPPLPAGDAPDPILPED